MAFFLIGIEKTKNPSIPVSFWIYSWFLASTIFQILQFAFSFSLQA